MTVGRGLHAAGSLLVLIRLSGWQTVGATGCPRRLRAVGTGVESLSAKITIMAVRLTASHAMPLLPVSMVTKAKVNKNGDVH